MFFLFLAAVLSMTEEMEDAIASLQEEVTFRFVDISLSFEERESLLGFRVERSAVYNQYGKLEQLEEKLPSFLRSLGANQEFSIQQIAHLIIEITEKARLALHQESAMISLRASLPHSQFDTPHWHLDGYYFSPFEGAPVKFVTSLVGNPTLFAEIPSGMRLLFYSHLREREFLSNLIDSSFIETAGFGRGALFLVGDPERAAVHSEPKIDSPRLFLSVLPGSHAQMEEIRTRRDR